MADKIGVLWEMLERADKILIGGRMAFTFLAAQGVQVGQTSIERAWLERAARMLDMAKQKVWQHSNLSSCVQGVALCMWPCAVCL